MHPATIKLATFAAASLAVVGVVSIVTDLILRDKSRVRDRLRDHFGNRAGARSWKSELFKDLNVARAQNGRRGAGLWLRFAAALEQSGLDVDPQRIVQIAFTLGVVGLILGLTLARMWVCGLIGAVAGLAAPFAYVYFVRKSRIATLRAQLPEAFELMSRAVKAGQTMQGAMNLVASQLKPPISIEFACCSEQQNLGLPHDLALQEFARRAGVMELRMFVVAMLVQRSAGGNPVEILDNLSDAIRKRVRLAGKVRACTSEGRMQAVVLSILPLAAFAALVLLDRDYAQVLLERPTLLCAVLGSEALGALWIRQIMNFQY
jgi:tight adherence protein B